MYFRYDESKFSTNIIIQNMTSPSGKFMLLLWKNYKIQSRHYIQALFEALFPILFTAALSFLRGSSDVWEAGEIRYTDFVPGCS